MDKIKKFFGYFTTFAHALFKLLTNLGISKDGYQDILDEFMDDMKGNVDNL